MKAPAIRELRRAFTLVELLIGLAILGMLFATGFKAWQLFSGQQAENLSKRLILQMEARKAFLNLSKQLQEGIEIVSPRPGTTIPYLVFKDYLNNVRMVYLEEDPVRTRSEKRPIYRALMVIRDSTSGITGQPSLLMEHVVKLNFTSHSTSGILVTCTLHGGSGDFGLINFIRLQNSATEDEPN
ncbi:MAG: type II secretion system protein [Candidatus Riflebacteria bacterium]|nr:type II secretion system protein [Candidatus Riflebacteria bacterium]